MANGSVLRILDCYAETNVLSFSELCKQASYPTDLGGYYIRQLLDAKCLVRTTRGQYEITPHGKQRLISLKRQQGRPTAAHARLCVMVIIKYGEKFVVVRRKRQPFIGFAEWPAMMLTPGESLDDSARQLLDTRLSVATRANLLGFFRRVDLYGDAVSDDKLFAVYLCELDPDSVIQRSSIYGDNLVLGLSELKALDKPARALYHVYDFSQNPTHYQEQRYDLSLEDIIPKP